MCIDICVTADAHLVLYTKLPLSLSPRLLASHLVCRSHQILQFYLSLYAQYVPCDVSTVCFGTAASMGAFLLGAGAKGKRRSLPNARIMIHQPLGGAQGQAADIEIQAKEILFIRSLLNSYIADYTGQPIEKIQEDCDRDFFMTPEEAAEYGIIDEVITTKTSSIPKPPMPSLELVY
eukprot:TRINITY_DN364_c0_g1_i4.p2 TRINITY_DN364_c0_g1~~TRINITY_DN364_c0_g1_i4.p2  ORF type:complete len:177 (-),score=21.29 TRINITY_DN364_c0_g1_i4:241-771(-)